MTKTILTILVPFLLLSCTEDQQPVQMENKREAAATQLPVKITRWKGNGNMDYIKILKYDRNRRLSLVTVTESNAAWSHQIKYTYEPGKITRTTDYVNPDRTDTKYEHYHNKGWVSREVFYEGNILKRTYTWENNPDGSKTSVDRNGNGELERIYTYYFTPEGNCTYIRVDATDPAKTDLSLSFDQFDTNPRAVFNHPWFSPWSDNPGAFTYPLLPNNPGNYKRLPDGLPIAVDQVFEYQYDSNGNVVFQKTFDALDNGRLIYSTVYEYAAIN